MQVTSFQLIVLKKLFSTAVVRIVRTGWTNMTVEDEYRTTVLRASCLQTNGEGKEADRLLGDGHSDTTNNAPGAPSRLPPVAQSQSAQLS